MKRRSMMIKKNMLQGMRRYVVLLAVIALALMVISGCGAQSNDKQGNETPDYKDRGDAVDRFYAAIENGQPVFLYFYTDT